jgi:hypothetical protein
MLAEISVVVPLAGQRAATAGIAANTLPFLPLAPAALRGIQE